MKSNYILDHYANRNTPFIHGGGKNATEQLIKLMALNGGEKVLEIGFGTGATQVRLKTLFPALDLYGIERSAIMLNKAKNRLNWARLPLNQLYLINEQVKTYPFSSGIFDVVFFESVFGILPIKEIRENLSEIRRVLKPGAMLALNESMWLSDIPIDVIRDINSYCKTNYGINLAQEELVTIQDWKAFLSSEGFDIQTIQNVMPKYRSYVYGLRDIASLTYTYLGKIMTGFKRETRKFNRLINTSRQSLMSPGTQYIDAYLLINKMK